MSILELRRWPWTTDEPSGQIHFSMVAPDPSWSSPQLIVPSLFEGMMTGSGLFNGFSEEDGSCLAPSPFNGRKPVS